MDVRHTHESPLAPGKFVKKDVTNSAWRVIMLVLHHIDAYDVDLSDIVAARRLGYLSSLDGKIKPSLSLSHLRSGVAALSGRPGLGDNERCRCCGAGPGENDAVGKSRPK